MFVGFCISDSENLVRMNRYCPNCRKEFDFAITSIEDLDGLVCPECGCRIERNSRRPLEDPEEERLEMSLGLVLLVLFRIGYYFFAVFSLLGAAAFFLHVSWLLRLSVGICLATFLLQLVLKVHQFRTGPLFLPLGAAAGFFFMRSLDGACLGICAVFMVRHIMWEIFSWIIGKIMGSVLGPVEQGPDDEQDSEERSPDEAEA